MIRALTRVEFGGRGEDRVLVHHLETRTFIVVADGAGGTGGGAQAAELTCRLALEVFQRGAMSSDGWVAAISAIDSALSRSERGGQSTVVALEINGAVLTGASVGDSGAWAIDSVGFVDLTSHQNRKPLLGTGDASPAPIGPTALPLRLLVATDGLLKYCPHAEIGRLALEGTMDEAIDALVSRVRLRGGGFQDDVAIVLCEDAG